MPNKEQLLYQTEQFLKILQYSRENTCVKFLRHTHFKKHMHTAASELTSQSDCLELCF